jgi:hypothetical protein
LASYRHYDDGIVVEYFDEIFHGSETAREQTETHSHCKILLTPPLGINEHSSEGDHCYKKGSENERAEVVGEDITVCSNKKVFTLHPVIPNGAGDCNCVNHQIVEEKGKE